VLAEPYGPSDEPSRQWLVVSLPAEIDIANAANVRDDLVEAMTDGMRAIVVDMSSTVFCDCAGVGALLAAAKHASQAGSEFRIVATTPSVVRIFELTGVLSALPVYPSISAATDANRTA
jgi:anti-sigma B factor antagonist